MFEILRTIYKRLTADGSTEEQAVRSGVWAAGINVGDRVLQLLKVVILARLLSPEAFGLLGIALLVLSGLRRFSNLGFNQALIQHQDENVDAYLNTAWMVNIGRGVLIAAISFVGAPYLARFFNEPQAALLIQVIGAANLFLALQNPAIVYFRKGLNFHKEFGYKMSARLADLGVAVGFALAYGSVWALALGITTMNFVQLTLSYFILDYRPNLEFKFEYAREMFGFGKWMFAQAVLGFFFIDGDDAFVGWFFTASALGFYQIAYRYSNAPATEITQVIRQVAFPAFSKVQNDVGKLRSGFFRLIHFSTIVSFPIAAGIFVVAPQFVHVVFGNQWKPMVPLMQMLALWGAVRSLFDNFRAVFKAVGSPEYISYLLLLQIGCVIISIYPAAEIFGVVGVAYVIVGQNIISLPIGSYLTLQIIEGKPIEYLRLIIYPAFASTFMAISVYSINNYILTGYSILSLFILILSGIVVYIVYMLILEQYTQYEFSQVYRRLAQSI
ncbi:lipopolysaccharide biosynthesis protein [Candidatus Halobonum tyrrellensis]|uniref:Export protein n=1 Tax=Candidatus Halobonum tyrrellensis G22 TaxID=1324957 RepID=V4HQ23_9EURY|nr:lipopolysaccharide biosynthesis protein [Candidatus Halobonum tyrrellensis]ESP90014.1 export protein [Candidatus Halobonum tyrrellensis G22]